MHASTFKPLALIILALAVILAGCTPAAPTPVVQTQPPVAPTIDQQAIQQTVQAAQTQAVSTAMAELTANAPTVTETSAPTETVPPTAAPTIPLVPTNTAVPVYPTWTYSPLPTITSTTSPYQCSIDKLNPAWNTKIKVGGDFDLNVTIENTGVNRWEANAFDFKYSSGAKFGAAKTVRDLPKNVKKGETVQFIVDMVAPNEVGTYQSTWVLAGSGFTACVVSIQIKTIE